MKSRFTRLGLLTSAALMVIAGPASATQAGNAGFNLNKNGNGTVVSDCEAVAGFTTSFNEINFVVRAQATAAGSGTRVAVGSGVVCKVKDKVNGTEYGRVQGGLPGPHAEAVGIVSVPLGRAVVVEVCGSAVYNDGTGTGC